MSEAPPEDIPDVELPGMWERADFMNGPEFKHEGHHFFCRDCGGAYCDWQGCSAACTCLEEDEKAHESFQV